MRRTRGMEYNLGIDALGVGVICAKLCTSHTSFYLLKLIAYLDLGITSETV